MLFFPLKALILRDMFSIIGFPEKGLASLYMELMLFVIPRDSNIDLRTLCSTMGAKSALPGLQPIGFLPLLSNAQAGQTSRSANTKDFSRAS